MRNILFMLDLTTRDWIEFDLRYPKTIPIWMQNRRARGYFYCNPCEPCFGKNRTAEAAAPRPEVQGPVRFSISGDNPLLRGASVRFLKNRDLACVIKLMLQHAVQHE